MAEPCFGSGVAAACLDCEAFRFQHTLLGYPSFETGESRPCHPGAAQGKRHVFQAPFEEW